jgi:exonuclease SbcC
LAHAQSDLQGIAAERAQITTADQVEQAREAVQRQEAAQARATLQAQEREHCTRHQALLARIDTALAELPAAFDDTRLQAAQAQCEQAGAALATADAAHGLALSNCRAAQVTTAELARHAQRLVSLDARLSRCEQEVSTWTLLAKALSHDGVIALCIDDAGPTLGALANDLLLSCYGPRFTVAIHTLVETAKGQAREGFDIVVHDAESGQSKSVTLMSGGERVWINEALTRAVALYLAQGSSGGKGARYATLFSDEADGPLDPERKRMFVAMKREVLALGGYEREFYISQTPELTALADAVIDVEALIRTPAELTTAMGT